MIQEVKDIELQEPKYELVSTEKKDPPKEKDEKEDSPDKIELIVKHPIVR